MNILECILIVAGISLDLFATMEIEGAKLGDIKKKTLIITALFIMLLQLGFFFGGYAACMNLGVFGVFRNTKGFGEGIAFLIFAILGVRLFVKGVKRDHIEERRGEITRMTYVHIVTVTTLYTLFAGCACGLLGSDVILLMITIIVCSFLVVIFGLYTGYMLGYGGKNWLYIISACLLWATAIEILIRIICMYV